MNVSLNTSVLIPKISSKAAAGTKQNEKSKTSDNLSFKGADLLAEINKFYDLLLQRNSGDISELAKILNKIEITDDKELDELHSVLKILLEAKTPDGNIIFGSNEASDRTSKTMMPGIANILNAKYNCPEKFEKLMNLLQLTKEGKIPPFVLGTLSEKADIAPEIFEAGGIRHRLIRNRQIKQYTQYAMPG